ncbi:hypothetical protein CBL_11525 [Carabus blaptoides fortunei]
MSALSCRVSHLYTSGTLVVYLDGRESDRTSSRLFLTCVVVLMVAALGTTIGARHVAAIPADDIIAQIKATRAAGGGRMRKGDEIYLKTEKETAKEEATRSFMKCEQRRSGLRAHERLKNG